LKHEEIQVNNSLLIQTGQISSPSYSQAIEGTCDFYQARHRKGKLFFQDDWKEMPDADQRAHYLHLYQQYAQKFPEFNVLDEATPHIIPLLQGSSEEAVWEISQNGFGITGFTEKGSTSQTSLIMPSNMPSEAPKKLT